MIEPAEVNDSEWDAPLTPEQWAAVQFLFQQPNEALAA